MTLKRDNVTEVEGRTEFCCTCMAVVEVHSLLVVENCTEQEVYGRVEVEDKSKYGEQV